MKKWAGEYRVKKETTWNRASSKLRKTEIQAQSDCKRVAFADIRNEIIEFRIVNEVGDVILKSHIGSGPHLTWYSPVEAQRVGHG